MNAFSERRVLFTRGLRMATSTKHPVFLPIVLNHVVHVALFKLHYFGFVFQLVSPPDIHFLRNTLLYCLLYFLLLCDTLLMTHNHNKTTVHDCGSFSLSVEETCSGHVKIKTQPPKSVVFIVFLGTLRNMIRFYALSVKIVQARDSLLYYLKFSRKANCKPSYQCKFSNLR